MHISASLKKETICFVGPVNIAQTYPWNTNYKIISAGLNCSPCYISYTMREIKCTHPEYEDNEVFPCMEKIDVKRVLRYL